MIINGVELENLDVFDVEIAEKYENALEKAKNVENEIKGLKISAAIRKQCETVFGIFNELFGEGTDRRVFGDKVNLITCLKAFDELVTEVETQSKEIEKITNKYSPNRLNRRNKK